MRLDVIIKYTARFIADNSPAILTGIGVTGTLVTAYLASKATYKVAQRISYEEANDQEEMPIRVRWSFVKEEGLWKHYIPAVGVAVLTVGAIICANHIGTRRAAAATAAYALADRMLTEYQEQVKETLGEKKEQAIREIVAQKRVDQYPIGSREVVFVEGKKHMCFESFTARYFYSDWDSLRKLQNDLNERLLHDGFVSLSDFFDEIGLAHTSTSDNLGWRADLGLIDFQYDTTFSDKKDPCIYVGYKLQPKDHSFR